MFEERRESSFQRRGHFFNRDLAHKRLIPAGPDHAQVAASTGVVEYFDAIHNHHFGSEDNVAKRGHNIHDLFQAQERLLMEPLMEYLRGRNDIRLLGPETPEDRAPTLSMITKKDSLSVAGELANHGVMAAGAHFYSYRLFEGMGLDPEAGALRMSFVHYTSESDIQKLIKGLDTVL